MTKGKPKPLDELQADLSYFFADPALLEEAMTHPSVAPVRKPHGKDYNRLEFLGDRVVGLLTAAELFERYPQAEPGELALLYNAMVRKESLTKIARQISLGPYLRLAKSEQQSGGMEKAAVLSDALEALVGALYLDGGLGAARSFFLPHLQAVLASGVKSQKDPKTALQESAHTLGLGTPEYQTLEQSGLAHAPIFVIQVRLANGAKALGRGTSKREAEQAAASVLLESLSGS